jgi:hypothetical protein
MIITLNTHMTLHVPFQEIFQHVPTAEQVCQSAQLVFQPGTPHIQSTSLTHLIAIRVHPSDITLMF